MLKLKTAIIAAVSDNGVIGKDNDLPWKIPADLKYFKEKTLGTAIIMGRKTFESFGGRTLPNRLHIIVSTTLTEVPDGVIVVRDLKSGLYQARLHQQDAFVIGGRSIFKEALDLVDTFYLTEVHGTYEGDVKFPNWDRSQWSEDGRTYLSGEPSISFVTLNRRNVLL